MSTLLEYECRPSVGGYDVATFDQARATKGPWRAGWGTVALESDATDDERYMANRWGDFLLIRGQKDPPGVIEMLRPRSERTKRFDLFEFGPSTFLEFAQTPRTADGVKVFADRYGPLATQQWDFYGHYILFWYHAIREMRKAIDLWDKATTTGEFSKIIRVLERRSEEPRSGADVLLKKDPLSASARLCIRPSYLLGAMWIQLALAIDGNLNLRACVECRRWFTLAAGRGRSDKEYCSNACRMRAYRKRKGSC